MAPSTSDVTTVGFTLWNQGLVTPAGAMTVGLSSFPRLRSGGTDPFTSAPVIPACIRCHLLGSCAGVFRPVIGSTPLRRWRQMEPFTSAPVTGRSTRSVPMAPNAGASRQEVAFTRLPRLGATVRSTSPPPMERSTRFRLQGRSVGSTRRAARSSARLPWGLMVRSTSLRSTAEFTRCNRRMVGPFGPYGLARPVSRLRQFVATVPSSLEETMVCCVPSRLPVAGRSGALIRGPRPETALSLPCWSRATALSISHPWTESYTSSAVTVLHSPACPPGRLFAVMSHALAWPGPPPPAANYSTFPVVPSCRRDRPLSPALGFPAASRNRIFCAAWDLLSMHLDWTV